MIFLDFHDFSDFPIRTQFALFMDLNRPKYRSENLKETKKFRNISKDELITLSERRERYNQRRYDFDNFSMILKILVILMVLPCHGTLSCFRGFLCISFISFLLLFFFHTLFFEWTVLRHQKELSDSPVHGLFRIWYPCPW